MLLACTINVINVSLSLLEVACLVHHKITFAVFMAVAH